MHARIRVAQTPIAWLPVPILRQNWSLSLSWTLPPPHVCNWNIVNCLLLPKSQAFWDPSPCNSSLVFYLSWQPANPFRAPFIICIDLHLSTAEPICRPSLDFSASFNDQETCHLELTWLQNIMWNSRVFILLALRAPRSAQCQCLWPQR